MHLDLICIHLYYPTCEYKSDTNTFIFSLTNNDNKTMEKQINPNTSIYCSSCFGPIITVKQIQHLVVLHILVVHMNTLNQVKMTHF